MEKKHKYAMLGSIIHIVNGDWASLVGSLSEMDVVRPGTNISVVTLVKPSRLVIIYCGHKFSALLIQT